MRLSNFKIDYVHLNLKNLVKRLNLLIAFTDAGHNNQNNKIMKIREANILV